MMDCDAVNYLYLGVDPGKSGAFACVDDHGNVDFIKLAETEHDVATWLKQRGLRIKCGLLEQVSAMPKQGVASTFKFGASYGFCRGLLVSRGVRFETITPAKWQQQMRCRSKGDKNVTKAAAQRLFPSVKITHANADAILLAELARCCRH